MSSADRHKAAEIARLRRTLEKSDLLPEEYEHAQRSLDKLLNGPTCRFCERPEKEHGEAVCRVLYRFRLKHGKGSFPTDGQAADIRAAIKADEQTKAATERRKDAKSRQTGFGF